MANGKPFRMLEIIYIPFVVKGEEGREKGKTGSPNCGREGFTLRPSPLTIKGILVNSSPEMITDEPVASFVIEPETLSATVTANVRCTGAWVLQGIIQLEHRLEAVSKLAEKNIVIDCSELHYISSSGLRVFLMALKKISAAGGRFRLCSLQDNIREIFEIAGFNTIFSIFGTVDEATK